MVLKKPKHFRIVHLTKNINSFVIYSPLCRFKVFFPVEYKIYIDKMLVTKTFWCPLASIDKNIFVFHRKDMRVGELSI